MQASSDLGVLDFDIPFASVFVIAAGTELVATIVIMASVTWQVLFVAVFSLVATKYVQVDGFSLLSFFFSSLLQVIRIVAKKTTRNCYF